MSDLLNITLFVGAREYKYPVQRQHEEAYRKAAVILNERLARYAERFPGKSDQEYMMATMFDITRRLVQQQIDGDAKEVFKSLKSLNEEINEVL